MANAPVGAFTKMRGARTIRATLIEYALGTDPFADSSAKMPQSSPVIVGPDSFLILQFRRRIGASGLTYTVESSSDLAVGQWMTHPVP